METLAYRVVEADRPRRVPDGKHVHLQVAIRIEHAEVVHPAFVCISCLSRIIGSVGGKQQDALIRRKTIALNSKSRRLTALDNRRLEAVAVKDDFICAVLVSLCSVVVLAAKHEIDFAEVQIGIHPLVGIVRSKQPLGL